MEDVLISPSHPLFKSRTAAAVFLLSVSLHLDTKRGGKRGGGRKSIFNLLSETSKKEEGKRREGGTFLFGGSQQKLGQKKGRKC